MSTPYLSYNEITWSLPSLSILYFNAGISLASNSNIYPSPVTKYESVYFLNAIDSEATKIYESFIPIKIGEPFVVVHILWGSSSSMITIPHWGFSLVSLRISSVFFTASIIESPYPLNFPISWATTSLSVSLLNLTSGRYLLFIAA